MIFYGTTYREIHELKDEVRKIKTELQTLKAQQNQSASPSNAMSTKQTNYTVHAQPTTEVQTSSGKFVSSGFSELGDMQVFAVQYQQHHIKVKLCVAGNVYEVIALVDSG